MIKSPGTHGRASVTFTLAPAVGANRASVCGEWNGWSADAHAMTRSEDGGFSATIELEAGRTYRFRYLIDGSGWENDWGADAYVPNEFGGDDSLVDLTGLPGDAWRVPGVEPSDPPSAVAEKRTSGKAQTRTAAKTGATKAAGRKSSPPDPDAPVPPKRVRKAANKTSD